MPPSPEAQQRRIRKLKARIASPAEDHLSRCSVPDPITGRPCGRRTARAAKQGLSAFLCRYHTQFSARHGSPWCRSPTAATLRPYLRAAASYIALHRNHDPFIKAAINGVHELLANAGPAEIVSRLRSLPPRERARQALARLRDRGVKPERLLAIPLAVHTLIEEAPATVHRIKTWRLVAIAKAAHRLASGTHKRWQMKDDTGKVVRVAEMHVYPRSAGRVLLYLGGGIEREAELTIDHHLAAVLALKLKRYGPHPAKHRPTASSAAVVRP